MLWLRRLEIEGFGPFAERQTIEFPDEPGVTVIYGENMRGKTSLLAAIRYAFFGRVMARGLRQRRLLTVCNREMAAQGRYQFSVVLTFDYDEETYELSRSCRSHVAVPESDADFVQEVMLRRGRTVLGPDERTRALQHAFPGEIARFFLFDGELLQRTTAPSIVDVSPPVEASRSSIPAISVEDWQPMTNSTLPVERDRRCSARPIAAAVWTTVSRTCRFPPHLNRGCRLASQRTKTSRSCR